MCKHMSVRGSHICCAMLCGCVQGLHASRSWTAVDAAITRAIQGQVPCAWAAVPHSRLYTGSVGYA
jgi:hypothetical protein